MAARTFAYCAFFLLGLTFVSCQFMMDPCYQVPDVGLCKGLFLVYVYNASALQCQKFIYGGCGGNENRFDSIETCIEICKPTNQEAYNRGLPITTTKSSSTTTKATTTTIKSSTRTSTTTTATALSKFKELEGNCRGGTIVKVLNPAISRENCAAQCLAITGCVGFSFVDDILLFPGYYCNIKTSPCDYPEVSSISVRYWRLLANSTTSNLAASTTTTQAPFSSSTDDDYIPF